MADRKQQTYGLHAVTALITRGIHEVTDLYVQKDRHDKKIHALIELAKQHAHIQVHIVSRTELDSLTNEGNHQGIVALRKTSSLRIYHSEDLISILESLQEKQQIPLLLILDGVQDPHNLGASFRSADAFGVHALIVPKDKSVGITPVVSKVASGAVETVPFVQVINLARTLEQLKKAGIWIFGADPESKTESKAPVESVRLDQADLTGPTAIVLGAEGSGLRRLTREGCDFLIHIPLQGSVDSLNVSVATGICLYEVVRQRSANSRS